MTTETTIATTTAGRRPAPRRLTKGQAQAQQLVTCDCCQRARPAGREVVWCGYSRQYRAAALERRCEFFLEV